MYAGPRQVKEEGNSGERNGPTGDVHTAQLKTKQEIVLMRAASPVGTGMMVGGREGRLP